MSNNKKNTQNEENEEGDNDNSSQEQNIESGSENEENNESSEKQERVTKKSGKKEKNEKGKKEKGKNKSGSKKNEKEVKSNVRYFKLINAKTGEAYGRYTGVTPKQAASKGFTKMLQKMKSENKKLPKQCVIYLRESTRNSAKKYYGYEASRQKLKESQQFVIIDKETNKEKVITYNYRNRIKKVPVPDQIGGMKIRPKKNVGSKKATKSKTGTKNTKSKSASKKTSEGETKTPPNTKPKTNTKKTQNRSVDA